MATRKTTARKPTARKASVATKAPRRKAKIVETSSPTASSESIPGLGAMLDEMTGAEALEVLRGGRPPLTEWQIAEAQEEDFIRRLGVAMQQMLSSEQESELRRAFDQVSDAAEAADEAARKAGDVLSDFDMEAADVEALERVLSGDF